jgi:eukaryotic-like serine/threonine-protein kinase
MEHPLSRVLCTPKNGQNFRVRGDLYVLGAALGNGAVGLVHKAIRSDSNTVYAIKFLAPDPKYIEEDVFDDVSRRFKREGERGSNIDHDTLIKVHAYCDNVDGSAFEDGEPRNPFILMEYVRGRTLESHIKKYANTKKIFQIDRQRLYIAIQIVHGLHYLHKRKLVHRDIKPANIFIPKVANEQSFPITKIGDFGVMKWGDFHASLSTGVLTVTHQKGLGTMKYMSPEQATSPESVGVESDIYSLGITLFELFAGNILATPHHVFEIMNARLTRGTTSSRFLNMGYLLEPDDEGIAGLLLDMHLRGVSGRPTITKLLGHLEWEYERRYGQSWKDDGARIS